MRRGGVIVRVGGKHMLLPEESVRGVAVLPSVTPVEGLWQPSGGVGLANGEVMLVLCLDPMGLSPSCRDERTIAVLCEALGHSIALVGGSVEAAGLFEMESEGRARWGDVTAELLDVVAMYTSAEAALWADRAFTPSTPESSS
jgi:hypothetical protein